MSSAPASEQPIRARPVADAPIEQLLAHVEALSQRWAVALILDRPLAAIGELPLAELANAAPALCEQLIRALADDAQLAPLEHARGQGCSSSSVRLLGALSGTRGPSAVVEHVEALRGVLWEALLMQLPDASARLLADLSDRLAFICARLLASALAAGPRTTLVQPTANEPLSSASGRVLYSSPQPAPGRDGAVLIDEHDDTPSAPSSAPSAPASAPSAPAHAEAEPQPSAARVARSARAVAAAPEPQMPPAERPSRRFAAPAAPRPLPWDTPLQAPSSPPRVSDDDDAAEQDHPRATEEPRVIRASRAPLDRRSS